MTAFPHTHPPTSQPILAFQTQTFLLPSIGPPQGDGALTLAVAGRLANVIWADETGLWPAEVKKLDNMTQRTDVVQSTKQVPVGGTRS